MIRLEHSITINRPVEEVWKFMSNLENATKWDRGVLEAKQISDGPSGVGAIIRTRRQFMGRQQIRQLQITEWEPNRRVGLAGTNEQMTAQIRYTFEPVGDRTILTGSGEVDIRGLWKVLTPIISSMGKRDNEADLANVKRLLEA